MEKAKVYFTDMRVKPEGRNLQGKLELLMRKAGMDQIDFKGRFAAIKIHFGETGNLSFLRPNFARTVVDEVRRLGGKPFLTDCNTLYVGSRKDALEHIETAYRNGFTPYTTGCHVIIGDGLKGTDDVSVPVPNGEYVHEAKIGRAIMDADIIISLNHFKGHEMTGFGGALKNLGMGCGSRAGKMEQHYSGKPNVNKDKCRSCGMCAKNCAHGAISFDENRHASIDQDKCVGCGRCIGACNFDAIHPNNSSAEALLNKKMAEYAWAVVKDRPHFHISLVIDVSPYCDCHAENDVAIIPDVGMFASFDPVALDQACADACNRQNAMMGSLLDERIKAHGEDCTCDHDHFHMVSPNTDWKVCLEHAEKLGIGTREYELITVK